jgi:integrase/recombinase XerD
VTVIGKGDKMHVVLLPSPIWRELLRFRQDAGHLHPSSMERIVFKAAKRRRRREATHALERGAPIHLVQATLGHASVATTGRYLHAPLTDSSSRYLTVG